MGDFLGGLVIGVVIVGFMGSIIWDSHTVSKDVLVGNGCGYYDNTGTYVLPLGKVVKDGQ